MRWYANHYSQHGISPYLGISSFQFLCLKFLLGWNHCWCIIEKSKKKLMSKVLFDIIRDQHTQRNSFKEFWSYICYTISLIIVKPFVVIEIFSLSTHDASAGPWYLQGRVWFRHPGANMWRNGQQKSDRNGWSVINASASRACINDKRFVPFCSCLYCLRIRWVSGSKWKRAYEIRYLLERSVST